MSVEVLHGDARRVLAGMPDGSVDAVVCDPPYELGFMGKAWDSVGVAYDVRLWGEVLRVLKPGGHLLAFGGTRTYHRMACAIEDAGFEIRDSLHWLYGSGFPKSLDVSKAIDRAAGAEREVVGSRALHGTAKIVGGIRGAVNGTGSERYDDATIRDTLDITAPATDAARQWEGWGTALKPAHEPIVVARKPLAGTVAGNVLAYGTGALNIDGCRVGYQSEADKMSSGTFRPAYDDPTKTYDGTTGIVQFGGTAMRADRQKAEMGRWPANLVFTHAADCGDECVAGCPVAELDGQSGVSSSGKPSPGVRYGDHNDTGGNAVLGRGLASSTPNQPPKGDTGGASRFFTVTEWDPIADVPPFRYVPKPSKRERNAGLDGLPEVKAAGGHASSKCAKCGRQRVNVSGECKCAKPEFVTYTTATANHHPTVKPVALMRWLVRLVTPPGGTVLDPFAGSGTTLVAAVLEGFDVIGIEMTDDYLPIIEGRVAWAEEQTATATPTLFDQEAQP